MDKDSGSLDVDADSRMADLHHDRKGLLIFKNLVFEERKVATDFLVVDGERVEDQREREAGIV